MILRYFRNEGGINPLKKLVARKQKKKTKDFMQTICSLSLLVTEGSEMTVN